MASGPHTQTGGTPRADGYLEQLIASINDSARTARTAMTALLLAGVSLGAACFAADHEAQLREGALTFPQVGVSLPLVHSLSLAPTILIFLHLTLLIQIDLLAGKLRKFREELERVPGRMDRQSYRLLIFPFAFAYIYPDQRNRPAHLPMAFISWLAVVALPFAVLLFVLVRFLPFQDAFLTFLHQCWVILDIVLIWIFHVQRQPYPNGSTERTRFSLPTHRVAHVAYRRILLPCVIMAIITATFTQARIPDAGEGDVRRETLKKTDDVSNGLDFLCHWFGHAGDKNSRENDRESQSPPAEKKISVEEIVREKREQEILENAIQEPHSNQFGCRYINLADRTLVQRGAPRELVVKFAEDDDKLNEARQRHADGLLLRGRSLRYAVLNRSNLFRADLIGADLRHARLDQTDLTRAVLRDASMGNIALRGANLNGAVLTNARLDKAALECIFIKIPNPQLGNAESGSSCTQLKGANLRGVRLEGANLRGVRLQNADLSGASLRGATLSFARLQGATLSFARLQGADLSDASLQGADLLSARLQGANLFNARLQGANLRYASLQGADLRNARLQGADLRNARLQGADLRLLNFDVLKKEEVAAIEKFLETAVKDKTKRAAVSARLIRSMVSGETGYPVGFNRNQSAAKTEIFMKGHRIFADWDTPVHNHDEAKYFAQLVPQLALLACAEPDSIPGLARRAAPEDNDRQFFDIKPVPSLAAALLRAPCFKDLKLPEKMIAALKKERAQQAKAAQKSSGTPANTPP